MDPLRQVQSFFRDRFELSGDQAQPEVIDEAIRNGVPFRGTNLWVLIFAIFVASVGLNVNSTAVIIGAMLISPLMGPILGLGYGAAINDFGLVRTAALNVAIAAGISLATSALYFSVTPLAGAQSELLARTSPTLWDVLIALFGGLAGIVALTRRERSNVLPGVAIATALMPPLCTAGYGLAMWNLSFVLGALYLFAINSVFIAAATFVMVRFMRLPARAHPDPAASLRAGRTMTVVVVLTALPSLWLAIGLVQTEVFNARAERFLLDAFPPDRGAFVVAKDLDARERALRVTLVGEAVDTDLREALARALPLYGLQGVALHITQNEQQTLDVAGLRADLAGDLVEDTFRTLAQRDAEIARLREDLSSREAESQRLDPIAREVAAQLPAPAAITVAGLTEGGALVVLDVETPLEADTLRRLEGWLEVRTGAPGRVVQIVPPPPDPQPKKR